MFLWGLFGFLFCFFKKKKKKSKCGHPSTILYPEFVTMHFLKGGRQGKKPVCVLMYSSFCVHGFPVSGKGRKEEEEAHQVSREGREGPLRPHPWAGLIAKQIWGRGLPACPSLWCRILDTGHAVLIQGSCGSSQAPVFSELRTLSSSGNHATLC